MRCEQSTAAVGACVADGGAFPITSVGGRVGEEVGLSVGLSVGFAVGILK
jgi:hypothetical protein